MVTTKMQFSAGGLAFRKHKETIRVALISVGDEPRWQLPKGLIDKDESIEHAALREVREEAGIVCSKVALIDKIDYWFYTTESGARVRYHKFVYFFLLRYLSGSIRNHDDEVNEARWFEILDAIDRLAFESEKMITRKAIDLIEQQLN